ncbi:MAG: RNA polymerase sigma factor [Gracilimonas sp.]
MINWFKRRGSQQNSYSTNEEWINGLKPPPDAQAIEQLRGHLIKGLKASLYKYVQRDLDDFVEDIAQDSILKILDKYDTFRGDSKFTTWAMKISVREAYSELRKKRYKDISLEQHSQFDPDDKEAVEIEHDQPGPDRITHESMIVQQVMKIMEEELTEKQQKVLQLLMIDQVPMTLVSEMMDSNRNAIYKLVHDARLKLKNRMEVEGMDPQEILEQM